MSDSTMMLQVAIRCKPFTSPDKLGVVLRQKESKKAEIETINGDRQVRLPFSYAWWSAYGYKDKIQPPIPEELENTELVSQRKAYESIGPQMKNELLGGHAIVLFAYGLSGSGKTYTVFGIDDVHSPLAWFNFKTPHDHWGLFPRLVRPSLSTCACLLLFLFLHVTLFSFFFLLSSFFFLLSSFFFFRAFELLLFERLVTST